MVASTRVCDRASEANGEEGKTVNRIVVEASTDHKQKMPSRYCFPFEDADDPILFLQDVRQQMATTIFGPMTITFLEIQKLCPQKGEYVPYYGKDSP